MVGINVGQEIRSGTLPAAVKIEVQPGRERKPCNIEISFPSFKLWEQMIAWFDDKNKLTTQAKSIFSALLLSYIDHHDRYSRTLRKGTMHWARREGAKHT